MVIFTANLRWNNTSAQALSWHWNTLRLKNLLSLLRGRTRSCEWALFYRCCERATHSVASLKPSKIALEFNAAVHLATGASYRSRCQMHRRDQPPYSNELFSSPSVFLRLDNARLPSNSRTVTKLCVKYAPQGFMETRQVSLYLFRSTVRLEELAVLGASYR